VNQDLKPYPAYKGPTVPWSRTVPEQLLEEIEKPEQLGESKMLTRSDDDGAGGDVDAAPEESET
jgi:hypothetical protein